LATKNYFWSSRIFQNGGHRHLVFFKSEMLKKWSKGSISVIMPNFVAIGQIVAQIWRLFDFSKMVAVRHLAFVMCLDHRRRAFVGLHHCAKFGWNRYSSFDNMQVLIFDKLGLKTSIHAPTTGILPHLTQCRPGRGLPPYQVASLQTDRTTVR